MSSCHGVLMLQYSHVHYKAVKNIPFRFCLVNAKVVNVRFIVLIQSLLVLSWWFALGSIIFLVVSDFDCIITEGSSSNSASIFCFVHDRTVCVLSVKSGTNVIGTCLYLSLLKCVADV